MAGRVAQAILAVRGGPEPVGVELNVIPDNRFTPGLETPPAPGGERGS